jgi:NADH:ubiquinone oxidoreductase subunit D
MSNKSNASEVRHKLYMRLVVRMTEVFGGESRSIRIIRECLDRKLEGRNHIDA